MAVTAEQRTTELRKMQDFLEKEQDKLYAQIVNLQGQKERLDWTIRVVMSRIEQIGKEEEHRAALAVQQNEAMQSARDQGNVGVHPSERKGKIAQRKAEVRKEKDSSAAKKRVKKATDQE